MNIIYFAAAGGVTINFVHLIEYSKRPKKERPDFSDILYWIVFLLYPILGAFLAYVYVESGVKLTPILSFHIGLSAPLILRTMIEVNPMKSRTIDPGEGA